MKESVLSMLKPCQECGQLTYNYDGFCDVHPTLKDEIGEHMNTLQYLDKRSDGIFGQFTFGGDSEPFMVFATHAYLQDDGSYAPIVQPGEYTCKLGTHALHNGVPFLTYEILGVEGHSGILFHNGNYPWSQSEGCNLVGEAIVPAGAHEMVTNSVATFHSWMAHLNGVDTFQLQVQ